MVSSTVDHMVAITVFLAAMLLFIGLFNQTIQTAVIYQRHRATATKASDLLDNILLSPGIPVNWGQTNIAPTGFGLQDPEFTQYKISPFSLMRLESSIGTPVYYSKTDSYYNNITIGFGQSLLVPFNETVSYSEALKLLGINNTYGFSLTMTPIVTVLISEVQADPLTLSIRVLGAGSPLSYADISYCLIAIQGKVSSYPAYTVDYGTTTANNAGVGSLVFSEFDATKDSYVLIVYAHLSGLMGVGYHENSLYTENYVVPFISNFETSEVVLAHSWDVHAGDHPAAIAYNATFVLLSEDFTLREMPLNNETGKVVGVLNYGADPQHAYTELNIDTHNPGILIVTYSKSAVESGAVVMPWGMSTLAFPVTFGGDPSQQEWVATDMRHVTVGGISYEAKIAVWSLEGYQVVG